MLTRSDAVRYLRACGLHAAERDWGHGQTVVAATGGTEHKGIMVWARAMYLVPKGEGWTSFELGRPRPDDDNIRTLDDACARVALLLSRPPEAKETEVQTPNSPSVQEGAGAPTLSSGTED